MTDAALQSETQEIVIDEVFPHTPSAIWKVLTNGELINRWLMVQKGFAPVVGSHFSFQTPPDGEWDGVIHCHVLEAVANERLVYTWKSGHESNAGYVSRLDTVVTWTLARNDGGTRLRLVHSGFVMPKNLSVFKNVNAGWSKVVPMLIAIVAEEASRVAGEKAMSEVFSGGCDCGAIRYEVPSEPISENHCQCRDCQRVSGTGHGSYLTFARRGDVKLTGEAKLWEIIADSGNVKTRAFCATCGTPVYMTFSAAPDFFVVHAASLDDPSRFKPQKVMYNSRGHIWDHLDPVLPKFEKMPPR